MKMKYLLFVIALVSVLALGLARPVVAQDGSDDDTSTSRSDDDTDELDEEDEVDDEDESESEDFDDDDSLQERQAKIQERIEERQKKLEERFNERRTKIEEKLAGKRLERCERLETRINNLLDRSVERSRDKLAVFQRIEEGVKEFYVNKGLSAEGYEAALANADAKEADAIAAIDAMAEQNFECDEAESSNPGEMISEAAHTRHEALKAYRESIKELIKVVKQALEDSSNSDDDSDETEEESEV